jgi:hypothetical protein
VLTGVDIQTDDGDAEGTKSNFKKTNELGRLEVEKLKKLNSKDFGWFELKINKNEMVLG